MSAPTDADLADMARDELERALSLPWRDLAKVTPWGDSFDGFTPAGRAVTVERAYLWAEAAGGDILCEVAVWGGPTAWEDGARASALVKRERART
jgi:hypothetical protein